MARSQLQLEVSSEAQQHPYWAVVERVAASGCFHSSTRLKEFLFYVADCALRGAPDEATEQHIGMHVFQRPPGYNSSEDSIVRTQARSLRQKLTEYFSTEGSAEEIVISIPKGHYLPLFEPRHAELPKLPTVLSADGPAVLDEVAPLPAKVRLESRKRWLWAGIAVAIMGMVVAAALLLVPAQQDPVARFWAPFMEGNSSLVIYSNAVFVGDSKTGLRYAAPVTAVQQPMPPGYVDHYTGIGELASVYDLTRLFDAHHSTFTLKRSLLVTWDQARMSNLIFIGSVAENPSLRVLPSTRDFTMMVGDGFAGIVNHHPLPGEPALYQRPEQPLTEDYAIIALLPGVQPGKQMLVFSGLTTLGTQAAVEFFCHKETLDQLLAKVSDGHGHVRPFEGVLQTAVVGGVPMETRLVTVHLR